MINIRKIAGVILSAMLLGGLPSLAWTADATLPQTIDSGPGAMSWTVTNFGGTDINGVCDGLSDGMAIDDATSANGAVNAFDTAYQVYIDDQIFIAPDPVDRSGNVITAGPIPAGAPNLQATVEYLFSDRVQAARIRVIFDNASGNPIDTRVDIPVNFGSDANTAINATSSGDRIFGINDRWLVTSDGVPAVAPVNSTVFFGPDNPAEKPTATTQTVCEDDKMSTEGAGVTFNVTIPANSTRSLMFFAGLGDIEGLDNTVAGAIANVMMFDDPATIDNSLVDDLSGTEWEETLNWRYIRADAIGIGDGKGGSNGCTVQGSRSADPLFPVLLAGLSLLFFHRRRLHKR